MSGCDPIIKSAEVLMQQKQLRDQANATSFTKDPAEFFQKRVVSVEDALTIEKANLCMKKCQEPVDILKRVISSNLKEININI